MSLQAATNTINYLGSLIVNGMFSFIHINNVIGGAFLQSLNIVLQNSHSLCSQILAAVNVLLEDFIVFLLELFDLATGAYTSVVSLGDFCLGKCIAVVSSTIMTVQAALSAIVSFGGVGLDIGLTAMTSVHQFVRLLGSSIVLLVTLVPETIRFFGRAVVSGCQKAVDLACRAPKAISSAANVLYEDFLVETISGLMVIMISTVIIRKYFRHVWTWEFFCHTCWTLSEFMYLWSMKAVIALTAMILYTIHGLIQCLMSIVHVPMFHQAGMELEEDVDNLPIDETDEGEPHCSSRTRESYAELVKRRNRIKSDSIEEMLFEQVEREREDKLCVICQDREKCIMILPCKHLCICTECKVSLQGHGNSCPICRNNVRQTIKVYL